MNLEQDKKRAEKARRRLEEGLERARKDETGKIKAQPDAKGLPPQKK